MADDRASESGDRKLHSCNTDSVTSALLGCVAGELVRLFPGQLIIGHYY